MHAFSYFFLLFRVPLVPTSPTAPIRTGLYPSAPIRAGFCLPAENMMSGEISPAIWPKTMSCVPAYAHAYLVFLPARTQIPYRTHPHPSSPICTYLHPPKPDIVWYICIIYVNLNEKY
jgi:hypothetical protein